MHFDHGGKRNRTRQSNGKQSLKRIGAPRMAWKTESFKGEVFPRYLDCPREQTQGIRSYHCQTLKSLVPGCSELENGLIWIDLTPIGGNHLILELEIFVKRPL